MRVQGRARISEDLIIWVVHVKGSPRTWVNSSLATSIVRLPSSVIAWTGLATLMAPWTSSYMGWCFSKPIKRNVHLRLIY
jgi:phage gp37-like protein